MPSQMNGHGQRTKFSRKLELLHTKTWHGTARQSTRRARGGGGGGEFGWPIAIEPQCHKCHKELYEKELFTAMRRKEMPCLE